MPMLRRLAPRCVISLPETTIEPSVGYSKPAIMRRMVVLPQPEGPSRVMNSPLLTARSTLSTTAVLPNFLTMRVSCRSGSAISVGPDGGLRGKAREQSDHPHSAPGEREGDDSKRRGLIGAVVANQLQVRAECRAAQQARHRGLTDDDGEGEESAGEHSHVDIGEDHRRQDVYLPGAQTAGRFGQSAHIDSPQTGVDGPVNERKGERYVAGS